MYVRRFYIYIYKQFQCQIKWKNVIKIFLFYLQVFKSNFLPKFLTMFTICFFFIFNNIIIKKFL